MVRIPDVLAMNSKELASHAAIYAPAAIAIAVEIMGNPKAKDLARLSALKVVLAYAHGTPTQNVNLSGFGGADDKAGAETETERNMRAMFAAAAASAGQSMGAPPVSKNGYTEIGAPDPARDTPMNAIGTLDSHADSTLVESRTAIEGEVLAPIKSDMDSMPDKSRLAAVAVGMAVARGFEI